MALASVGAAEAKTVNMPTKMNKYCTKKVGNYKIQTFKWKSYSYQEVDIYVYKKGNLVKKNKYKSKVYYKVGKKSKSTKWFKGSSSATYHKIMIPKNSKVSSVKVSI